MKDDRGIVGRFDEVTNAKSSAFRRFVGGIHDDSNVALTSVAVSARPSWKRTLRRRWKTLSERVGSRPGFSKIAVKIHLIVALQQAAEEKSSMRWDCESCEARVEIGGAGFDEESNRRRIGLIALEQPERKTTSSARKRRTRKRTNAEITETQRREEKRNPEESKARRGWMERLARRGIGYFTRIARPRAPVAEGRFAERW